MKTPTVAEALVHNSPDLVSLPAVVIRVAEMLASNRYSAAEVGAVVSQDPALTARLLKVVNSPYYGFSGRVDTVSRAVALVGVEVLYTLILTTSVVHGFRHIPSSLVNMNDFWLHSIYCGEIARMLAKEASVLHAERLFIAGLLHRVGSLIVYTRLPDQALDILMLAAGDERLLPDLEQGLIGCTYAEIGAELSKAWKLPVSLSEAIRWQLQPECAEEHRIEASLLYIARRCKDAFLLDIAPAEALDEVPGDILASVGLAEGRILDLLAGAGEKLATATALFLPEHRARG